MGHTHETADTTDSNSSESSKDNRDNLRWRDSGYTGQRRFKMELHGRRKRRRPQRRVLGVVKEEMQRVIVTQQDVRHKVRWRQMTCF